MIVDYLGIFNDLRKALAIYASTQDPSNQSQNTDNLPIQDKSVLIPNLRAAVQEAEEFCQKQGIDLAAILVASKLDSLDLLTEATDKIVITDQKQRQFISLVAAAERNYNSILPEKTIQETYEKRISLLIEIVRIIYSLKGSVDVSSIMEDITKLLSASVTTTDYVVRKITENSSQYILPERIDLSKIDYEALAKDFKTGNQAIKYDRLRGQVAKRMQHMLRRNKNKKRIDYQDEFRTNDRRVQPGKCKSGDTLLQTSAIYEKIGRRR